MKKEPFISRRTLGIVFFVALLAGAVTAHAADIVTTVKAHISDIPPTSYTGFMLVSVGLGLLIAEMYIPGFGLPAIGGIICLGTGAFYLFQATDPVTQASRSAVLAVAGAVFAITLITLRAVVTAHRKKTASGKEGMISECGVAMTDFSPRGEGTVFVHGENWSAKSADHIAKDDMITVIAVDRLLVTVKKQERKS